MSNSFWTLNDRQYFEAPGLVATFFHDFYPEGRQGGLTLIQHGERVAACGDVRLSSATGQWHSLPQVEKRQPDAKTGGVHISAHFADPPIHYTVRVWPENTDLCVAVDFDAPIPTEWEGLVGFNLELYPGVYFGRTFHLGQGATAQSGVFPRQPNGPVRLDPDGALRLTPLASGTSLAVAPEDPLRRMTIASESGALHLYDGRDSDSNGWFVVRELAAAGATDGAIRWRIALHGDPDWRRAPVICISQVGYHPDQVKQAILELDPRSEALDIAVLKRLGPDGLTTAQAGMPVRWGRWLYHEYAIFDFTAVREPGLYTVRYGDQVSPPFAIHPEVYQRNVWQPTLETYFPVQMCHVTVREGSRVWHGACHLDDALQAPVLHPHFDGYHQYEQTDTPYAPGEHIPHLDVGGWHDAGDYDLAAGSQARTTHALALIREMFGVDSDQTTVKPAERLVLLHRPDGVPDVVEQVAHGAQSLLSGYRATAHTPFPHSFHGIIAATIQQYAHLGDAATMTDKRWAFTNHDTALEYQVAAALAAASRVLRGFEDALADECLQTAVAAWDYEHAHDPVSQPAAYVPRDPEAQEIVAAVELLLATGDARYRERLLSIDLTATSPAYEGLQLHVSGALARAIPSVGDPAWTQNLRLAMAGEYGKFVEELDGNPFGVLWQPHVWGVGWQIQKYAVDLYLVWQAFPDLVDREIVLRVVNYVLGCHPASNLSLTSGVGAQSVTAAYGVNRAEWSCIPGGMVSGVALIRPDFPELKAPWPFLWQQTEYVMSGAANYIFCVLAADRMLNS
ncbi:MAG: glycoside hydrolase family 9 protein [Anaerolineae bacterium]|nr:glycoside hydrolase family 9 protein [Anaerolineae bacterium]